MRALHLFWLLPLTALFLGCPQSSGTIGDDDAADDDAADDDAADDDVADDDVGDDDAADDDMATESCEEVGEGGIYFDAGYATQDGMTVSGELGWDGEFLTVTPMGGPVFGMAISHDPAIVDMSLLMDGIAGPGRLYLVSLAAGAWTHYGVVAAITDDGQHIVVLGMSDFPGLAGDFFGFYLSVEAQEGVCPAGVVDISGCGEGSALPLEVIQGGEDSPSYLVWPGEDIAIGDFVFHQYAGYQVFENLCDDFDDRGLNWSMVKN